MFLHIGQNAGMRFRLQTLFFLIVAIAIGLAWWRDHVQLISHLELNERQIRQLQRQVDESRFNFTVIAPNIRFKTPEELVEFVRTATDSEFSREDWSAFGKSHVAEQAVGPLAQLLNSGDENVRRRAAVLLGFFGDSKRLGSVDPIPALIAALQDSSSSVRSESAYALGQFGSHAHAALPVLLRIMRRDQGYDAFNATRAVKKIAPSEDIGPRLRDLFVAGEKGLWRNVAFWLPDHLPAAEARQLLIAKGEQETDSDSREILAQAMNKIKD